MARSVLALPISIEQLAAVIRHMNAADRQRLLALAPELRQDALQLPPHTPDPAQTRSNAYGPRSFRPYRANACHPTNRLWRG